MAQITVEQLGANARQQFPDRFNKNVSDIEIGKLIIQKNPKYRFLVSKSINNEQQPISESKFQKKQFEDTLGGKLLQGASKPFLKTITSGLGAIEGGSKLAVGALSGGLSPQEIQQANEAITRERNFGVFGSARPVTIDQTTGESKNVLNGILDILGTGLEIGSNVVGAGEVGVGAKSLATVLETGLKGAIKTGAKEGFILGTTSGLGFGLQESDQDKTFRENLQNIITSTALGGVGGAILGGLLSGISTAGVNVIGKILGRTKGVLDNVDIGISGGGGGGGGGVLERAKVAGQSTIIEPVKKVKSGIENLVERNRILAESTPVERQAIRSGIDKSLIDFIKESGNIEKSSYKTMFDIFKKRAEKVGTKKGFPVDPKSVVGNRIIDRASFLLDESRNIGKQIGNIVDKMPKKTINITDEYNAFLDVINKAGIRINNKGELSSVGNIPDSALPAFKKILSEFKPKTALVDRFGNEFKIVRKTPKQIHDLRSKIFKEFKLAKQRLKPFGEDADKFAEIFRTIMAQPLNELDSNYGKLSLKFAKSRTPLEEFIKYLGLKRKVEELTTKDLKAGEVAVRALGNASDRPISIIKNLDDSAKLLGYKETDNIYNQILMFDILENIFGTQQTRSLRGEVGRAGVDVLSTVKDLATLNAPSLVTKGLQAIVGNSNKETIKGLEILLKDVVKP